MSLHPSQVAAARRATLPICQNCGAVSDRLRINLCNACYVYQQRTGRSRPRVVYDKANRKCRNCGQRSGQRLMLGLCSACYSYQYRTGKPRPRALYEKAVEPKNKRNRTRCDCGQPATRQVEVRCGMRGGYKITLDLCESCWQIEKGFRL